jgi:hypothetical protein
MANVFDQFDSAPTKNVFDQFDAPKPEEKLPERTFGEFASDVGVSAAKGIIGVPQALVGLADIAGTPFGVSPGKYLEEKGYDFEKNQKLLDEQYSPRQKAEAAALSKAEGITGNILAAIANPSAVGGMLMESVPSIAAGGIMGKVAKVAAGLGTATAAGVGEGLIGAGSAASSIRSESEDKELSGKGAISALGSGVGTGVLGAVGSKLTTALGGIDVDTLLVGSAKKALAETVGEAEAVSPSMFRRIVTSTLGEGVLEEAPQSAQEKMFQNYATDKPLLEGVEDAAIKGGLLGAIMGGTVGAISGGTETAPTIPPPDTTTGEVEKEEEQKAFDEAKVVEAAVDQTTQDKDFATLVGGTEAASEEEQAKIKSVEQEQEEQKKEENQYISFKGKKLDRYAAVIDKEGLLGEVGAAVPAGEYYDAHLKLTDAKGKNNTHPYSFNAANARYREYQEQQQKEKDVQEVGSTVTPHNVSEAEQNLSIDEQDEELSNISALIEKQAQEFTPTHLLNDVVSPRFPNRPLKAPIPVQLVPVKDLSDPFEATFYKDQQGNLHSSDISNDIKPIALETEAVKVPEQEQEGELVPVLNETELNQIKNIKKPGYVVPKKVIEPLAKKVLGEEFNAEHTPEQLATAVIAKIAKEAPKEEEGLDNIIRYEKGYKPTVEPSADNFLNQIHIQEANAPKTVEEGIKHAGAAEAIDMVESAAWQKSIEPKIKAQMQIAQEKANRESEDAKKEVEDSFASQIAFKEKSGPLSKEWVKHFKDLKKEALDAIKAPKYTTNDVLKFMKLSEVVKLYKENKAELKNWHKGTDKGGALRLEAAKNRAEFIKTLTPEQKIAVNKAMEENLAVHVNANLFSRHAEETKAKETEQEAEQEETVSDKTNKAVRDIDSDIRAIKYTSDQLIEMAEADKQLKLELKESLAVTAPKAPAAKIISSSQKALQAALGFKDLNTFTGPLYIISENGSTPSVKNLALKLMDLVDKLAEGNNAPKVVFRLGETIDNADGQFDPATGVITLNGKNKEYIGTRSLEEVVLHEMAHYLTDHMIDNRKNKKFAASLTEEQKAALNRLDVNYKVAKAALGTKFEIGTIKEFIAETMSNRAFQAALNGMPSVSTYSKAKNLLTEIVNNIGKALFDKNFIPTSILAESFHDILTLTSLPTEGYTGKGISFAKKKAGVQSAFAKPEAKKAEADVGITSAFTKTGKTALKQPKIKRLPYFMHRFFTVDGWTHTVHALQNDRYFAKRWEDALKLADKIISDPAKAFNNIYEQLTLAQQGALNYRKKFIIKPLESMQESLKELNNHLKGNTIDDTLNVIQNFRLGLNGKERRLTKFVMTVPLSTKEVIKRKLDGTMISPQDRRFEIIGDRANPASPNKGLLNDPRLSEADAKLLRDEVNGLVALYAAPLDPKDGNPNNSKYNTLGISAEQENSYVDEYNNLASTDPKTHALIKKIFDSMKELSENTKKMDKESNFWSKPVGNWVAFYGWEDYSPFKGNPKHNTVDEFFDLDTVKQGKEYQDFAKAWGGRGDDAENVVLQTITDASRAADRAGRKNLTQSILNAATPDSKGVKLLNANIEKIIPFSERNTVKDTSSDMRILHYNADGSIVIIKFEPSSKKILESIRRTYDSSHPFWDVANSVTSLLGQVHTRYNYNFAPMNFVRDILTNAWVMGAERGPKKSAEFIATIANKVIMQNGLWKAMKVSKLYEDNNSDKLKELAKTDPYIRDMVDYINHGGKVSYMASMGVKSNYEELLKITGKSGLLNTKAKIDYFVNVWNEMFEIASRSAAYGVMKKTYMDENLSEDAAGTKAASYVKNLANFEQVGSYGKELGALYMFARPSATGAVRSIEAIAPAFPGAMEAAVKRLPNSGAFKYKEVDGKRVYSDPSAINSFTKNYKAQQKNARIMATVLMGMGVTAYMMSMMMADDDDQGRNKTATDNMDQWARFARFHVPGTEIVFQIPWGFGLGSFASAGAQLAAVGSGNTPIKEALKNIFLQISLDSFVPIPVSRMDPLEDPLEFALDSVTPSAVRPLLEFALNKNGLGQDIYKESMGTGTGGEAYNRGDKVPETWNDVAAYMADNMTNPFTGKPIDIAPNSLYFFANSYADGASRLWETMYNMRLKGKKDFSPKNDLPLIGSFFGTSSSVDAREFGKMEEQIKEKRGLLKMYESNPEQYEKYIAANPMDETIVDIYDKVTGSDLNDLYHEAKEYRKMKELTPKEREALIKPITLEINVIKNELLQEFKAYGMKPY